MTQQLSFLEAVAERVSKPLVREKDSLRPPQYDKRRFMAIARSNRA